MPKSSRWSQWVIAESAYPGIPMPWAVPGTARQKAVRTATAMPSAATQHLPR